MSTNLLLPYEISFLLGADTVLTFSTTFHFYIKVFEKVAFLKPSTPSHIPFLLIFFSLYLFLAQKENKPSSCNYQPVAI